MKRRDFLKMLEERDIHFLRHGSNHDIYAHRISKKKIAIPRHGEIENDFAKIIMTELAKKGR